MNTAILFIAGLFAIYFSVDWIIADRADKQLKDTSKEVRYKLSQGIKIEYSPLIEIESVPNDLHLSSTYKDTLIYFQGKKETEEYRQYTVYKEVNDKNYKITVRASLIEKEDLFSAILLILSAILILLLIVLTIINRYTAGKIFKPFYNNLKNLEKFSLQKNRPPVLDDSNIDEFNELKKSLMGLSGKALKEYRSLKEFSEDLAHELQTPVAVIKAKTEMLLQKEFMDNETTENLQVIITNTDRLDKLNRSLILLARLETAELFPSSKIRLCEKLEKVAENYSDIANSKEIVVHLNTQSSFELEFNENLIDILLSNLISNAIKHNITGGELIIELTGSLLTIKNNGKEPKQNPENYFKRFSYDEKSQSSLGLGLAIAKKICDLYKIKIEYLFEKPFHIVRVNFNLVN
ncbi:MAG: HAMP domain-containing sensor histidine kinase [Ignavibacteriales bacterium]|nr:HAMP domain-containing sensor histidine kinase [Ignavibacteriales bacterium]